MNAFKGIVLGVLWGALAWVVAVLIGVWFYLQ